MKTNPELPGPVGRAELKSGDPAVTGGARRKAGKAVLYVILPLVLFASFIRLFPVHSVCIGKFRPTKPKTIDERVEQILRHTPLIDGHNDLAIFIRAFYNNHIYNETFSEPFAQGGLPGHVDIPRLQAGMNGGAFWSVFWPCPVNGTDFSDENYHSTVQQTLQQIDLLARLRHSHPSVFSPPTLTSTEALHRFRHSQHNNHHHHHHGHPQLISPLGIEGLHQIGNSAAVLRQFHALGVRYATLTHNCGNRFADAALHERPLRRAAPFWGGLSPAGRRLVREMNRLGMIVDLAHTSVDTMLDVLGGGGGGGEGWEGSGDGGGGGGGGDDGEGWEGSEAPVVFSHSSAYALCPHPRNVPDEVLDLVGRKRGLVMVNFNPDFISCVEAPDRDDGLPEFYAKNATLQQVARHVLYIGERIGFDHVGLGSDFAGIVHVPEGLEDVSKFPDLVAELLRQGVSDRDAAKVVGGNMLRVWGEVEAVAQEMQKRGEPVLEDELPSLWSPGYRGTEKEL